MKSDIRPIGNSYSEPLIDLILTIQQKEFNIPVSIEDQPDLIEIENFLSGFRRKFLGCIY